MEAGRVIPKTLKWGLGLALLSFIFAGVVLGPIAFILCVVALVAIFKDRNRYKGVVLAVILIPITLFSASKSAIRISGIIAEVRPKIEYRQTAVKSVEKAQAIREACFAFADSQAGRFPDELVELVEGGFLESTEDLESPLSSDSENPHSYEFLLPGAIAEDHVNKKTPLIRDPHTAPDGRQVTVFTDGSKGAHVPP